MMSAASSALNLVLTGISTPPAISNPNAAIAVLVERFVGSLSFDRRPQNNKHHRM